MSKANLGASQGFDLYPVLLKSFEDDPGATSIDVFLGENTDAPKLRRITRAEFEQERLTRDTFRLLQPIGRVN